MPVEISRYSFRVFSCACPTVISSISGRSFHFSFPYFVIFVVQYFPFHVVCLSIDILKKCLPGLGHEHGFITLCASYPLDYTTKHNIPFRTSGKISLYTLQLMIVIQPPVHELYRVAYNSDLYNIKRQI
jgi:hypothetical protein